MSKHSRIKGFNPLLLVVGLLVAALGLSACGFGGAPDAQEIIDKTFAQKKDQDVKSGKINFTAKGEVKGIKDFEGPFDIKLSGPFDGSEKNKFPKFDLSLSLSAGKTSFNAGAVSTGDEGFVSYQGTAYEIPPTLFNMVKSGAEQAQKQAGTDTQTSTTGANPLGIDPKSWLTDVEKTEDKDVGGATTYTVKGKIDVAKMVNEIAEASKKASSLGGIGGQKSPTTEMTDEDRKEIADSVKSVSFTLNSGKDDFILRRLEVKVSFTIPEDQQKDLNGLEGGDVKLLIELSDMNEKQKISKPKGAKPLEDLLKELGLEDVAAQLGALGGGGIPGVEEGGTATPPMPMPPGSGGTTTAPPGGPSAKATQEFLECVQKAEGNPEDAQKCSEKLQK